MQMCKHTNVQPRKVLESILADLGKNIEHVQLVH